MTDVIKTASANAASPSGRAGARRAQLSPELQEYAKSLAEVIDFRVRLHSLRTTLGLTQAQAGEVAGENQGDISRLESGELNPSIGRANRILERIGAYASARDQAPPSPEPTRSSTPLTEASDVAAYFCAAYDDEDSFSNLKLQKLLYYAQGYALVLLGRPLFRERIKAWEHGPVVPQIWQQFRAHEAETLPRPDGFDAVSMPSSVRAILDRVYVEFGQFEAWRLRDMTHQERPWAETPRNAAIPLELMRTYFGERLTARS